MIWVSSFRQFFLPASDRVRIKHWRVFTVSPSLVDIQSELEYTRLMKLFDFSDSEIRLKFHPLSRSIRVREICAAGFVETDGAVIAVQQVDKYGWESSQVLVH
jgi:hypothetical protein